jgi:segregation and condensation protein B
MDENQIKLVIEAALFAAGRPLTLDRLAELFASKGTAPDRAMLRRALDTLATDYESRGIELKEVATGFRVQVKRSMSDWLQPLWEERAPRYTRALLETLALIAYRQPITRAEIEEVRGVVVSTNIIRTLLERSWIRVVGHRDVPGKPAMFGTTKEFLDYFGLKKLEDLPPLAELKDGFPELSPQTDLIDTLEADAIVAEGEGERAEVAVLAADAPPRPVTDVPENREETEPDSADSDIDFDSDEDDDADDDLAGPDLIETEAESEAQPADTTNAADAEDAEPESAEIIPLRASSAADSE